VAVREDWAARTEEHLGVAMAAWVVVLEEVHTVALMVVTEEAAVETAEASTPAAQRLMDLQTSRSVQQPSST
jgi:hypothetical protein